MYCKAITIRLLVGRLTPAMRAKSVTPCSGQTVADPEGPGRYLSVRMSPEKGHKRKKPTAAMRFAARHRCSSPTGYLRLINGFRAVSSTSTRYFPYRYCRDLRPVGHSETRLSRPGRLRQPC